MCLGYGPLPGARIPGTYSDLYLSPNPWPLHWVHTPGRGPGIGQSMCLGYRPREGAWGKVPRVWSLGMGAGYGMGHVHGFYIDHPAPQLSPKHTTEESPRRAPNQQGGARENGRKAGGVWNTGSGTGANPAPRQTETGRTDGERRSAARGNTLPDVSSSRGFPRRRCVAPNRLSSVSSPRSARL